VFCIEAAVPSAEEDDTTLPRLLKRTPANVICCQGKRTMNKAIGIAAVVTGLLVAGNAMATDPTVLAERRETQQQHDARMKWWREARFGMFIHFGLYSVAAGEWNGKPVNGYSEWIMSFAGIPSAEYAKLTERFDPSRFDAEKIVLAAQNAGMKYIVITAKHHEGFAMYPSKASPFNIAATRFKRDPLKELAEACRKHGVKLGFYYSQNIDWHHQGGGGADKAPYKDAPDKYVDEVAVPQVRELLSNYGDIGILWWDMPGGAINKERAERLFRAAVQCNPTVIMNNRLERHYKGDTETPEQYVPPRGFAERDWEVCMTINDSWGFKKRDRNWKSAEWLIRQLCDIVSKGGNYLLNIGPTPEGEIPQPCVERLETIGAWMKLNGQAIHGTTATPFVRPTSWGRATQKGNMLYLLVFDLPADRKLKLPGLKTEIKRAWFLDERTKEPLRIAKVPNNTVVVLPADTKMDSPVMVVAAECDGRPLADASIEPVAEHDGVIRLSADCALVEGGTARLDDDHIGCWMDPKDRPVWNCRVHTPGKFTASLELACDKQSAGSEFTLIAGDSQLTGKIPDTGGWGNYQRVFLDGTLTLEQSSIVPVTVKVTKKTGQAVMDLRAVSLRSCSVAAETMGLDEIKPAVANGVAREKLESSEYQRGLCMVSGSSVEYDLPLPFGRFEAWACFRPGTPPGAKLAFKVLTDEAVAYDSGVVPYCPKNLAMKVSVPLDGVKRLALRVEGTPNVHAQWAQPRLFGKNKVFFDPRIPMQDAALGEMARTPLMGVNTWNAFGTDINEKLIKQLADKLVSSGLKDLGYNYLCLDDGYQSPRARDEQGNPQCNRAKFPSGMERLGDYIHGKGLKFGMYSRPDWVGSHTTPDRVDRESEDKAARTFAAWKIDFLKYDYSNPWANKSMIAATRRAGRPVWFNTCEWGTSSPWKWAIEAGAQSWRVTFDVMDLWYSAGDDNPVGILRSAYQGEAVGRYAGPGHWNDLDMLVIGLRGKTHLPGRGKANTQEYRSQMGLWSLLAAPLVIGGDIRTMDVENLKILMNKEVIAIDQDALGIPACRAKKINDLEAWLRPLANGDYAVGILNVGESTLKTTVTGRDLGLPGTYTVRDLWKQEDLGKFQGSLECEVQPHELRLLRFTPQ
jgi:alpha-L-fucosidase